MGKKKSSSAAPAVVEPVPDAPELSAADERSETEEVLELIQVDTGDVVKVKQVLDEAAVLAVHDAGVAECHNWGNIKLAVMALACAFACVAQFAPVPFPQSRPLLAGCCAAYFMLSGVLQLIITYVDADAIMVTRPPEGAEAGLRVRTNQGRYDERYELTIEFDGVKESPFVTKSWSVGKFFDVNGFFDEYSYMEEVEKVLKRFLKKDYDTPKDKKSKTE